MNSLWGIAFVVAATIVAKWLLFDDDAAASDSLESAGLQVTEPPTLHNPDPSGDADSTQISKSA